MHIVVLFFDNGRVLPGYEYRGPFKSAAQARRWADMANEGLSDKQFRYVYQTMRSPDE